MVRTFKSAKGNRYQNCYILILKESLTTPIDEKIKKNYTYDDSFDRNHFIGKIKITNMDAEGNLYDGYKVNNLESHEVTWFKSFESFESTYKVGGKQLSYYDELNLLIWYPIVNFHTYCYMAQNEQYFDIEYTHNDITYIMNTEGSLEPIQIVASDLDVSEEQFEKSYASYNTVYEMFEKYTFLNGTRLWDEKEKYINVAKKYFLNLP